MLIFNKLPSCVVVLGFLGIVFRPFRRGKDPHATFIVFGRPAPRTLAVYLILCKSHRRCKERHAGLQGDVPAESR